MDLLLLRNSPQREPQAERRRLPVTRDPLDSDFTLVFIAVRIGFEHGWSHIYSLAFQHQLFTELRPGVFYNDGQRYIAPPPLAWLTVPLTPFGAAGAFYAWTLLSVVALPALVRGQFHGSAVS